MHPRDSRHHSTKGRRCFKNLVIHSIKMMGRPSHTPCAERSSRTTFNVMGTMLASQDSFSKLQAFRIHLCTELSFVTTAATCTVQVFGRNVRHALHQPGHHRVLTETVTVQLALQSQWMYYEETLEQFLSIFDRALIFRLM